MKLNNRGFAISSIMYMILVLAVVLIALTLAILSSRKLVLDRLKKEVTNTIYEVYPLTYRETLNTLKEDIITYASANDIEKDSIKISELETSVESDIISGYKLDNKYLTVSLNSDAYDVYLGEEEIITKNNALVEDIIDIVDYKIYGNSYQETSDQGKNLFDINKVILNSGSSITSVENSSIEFNYTEDTNDYFVFSYWLDVEKNTDYSISMDTVSISGVYIYSDNLFGTQVTSMYGFVNEKSKSFNTGDNEKVLLGFYSVSSSRDGSGTEIVSDIQIEKGTEATTYEEFRPNSPSPDYPSEIESVGDKSKNLFDESLLLENSSITKIENGYSVAAYPAVFSSSSSLVKYLKSVLKPDTTYTLSRWLSNYLSDASGMISIRNSSDTLVEVKYLDGIQSTTFSLTQEEIDSISSIYVYGRVDNPTIFEYIQLEEGDAATDYIPYQKHKISININSKNLSPIEAIDMDFNETKYDIYIDEPFVISVDEVAEVSSSIWRFSFTYKDGSVKYANDNTLKDDGYVALDATKDNPVISMTARSDYITSGAYTNIMIEKGTTPTKYVPKINKTTNIYLDNPLRKINTYVDKLSFYDSQIERQVAKLTDIDEYNNLNGSMTSTGFYRIYFVPNPGMYKGTRVPGFCNVLPVNKQSWNAWKQETIHFGQVNDVIYLITKEYYPTWDEMKNYLTTSGKNELEINYPIKDISYETVELPKISTGIGTSTINVDASILPSSVEFTVIKKIKQI